MRLAPPTAASKISCVRFFLSVNSYSGCSRNNFIVVELDISDAVFSSGVPECTVDVHK